MQLAAVDAVVGIGVVVGAVLLLDVATTVVEIDAVWSSLVTL